MPRTSIFSRLVDTIRSAESRPSAPGASSSRATARTANSGGRGVNRRELLQLGAAAAGALVGTSLLPGCAMSASADDERSRSRDALKSVNANIGIVGAGIAGLACAYELQRVKVLATVHEGNQRIGGRVYSMGGAFGGPMNFPGQVIERGGELIDTPHKTMIGYAREFGLPLEDVAKPVRDTFYYFDGQLISESTMVDEYRVLVDRMRDDLRTIGSPTAQMFTPAERALDYMSLSEYLVSRGAPPNIKKLLSVAYTVEYGVEPDKMSCLAFLMFAKASRQSKIRLWGNSSDERYHVVGGNEQIPRAIAAKLGNQVKLGRKLLRAKKTAAGLVELTFLEGGRTITATHDAVIFAIPFNLLRDVELDASLGLPDWKRYAIQNSVYGTNAKLMIGFTGRPWVDYGSNGAAYSNRPYLQASWETNPTNANATRGVITDYTGGNLGSTLSPSRVQSDTENFLNDFDRVYPGAKAKARRDASGKYVAHLEHWPSSPWTKGSYSANQPGYFTTIADNEARSVGNVYFAGETTSSFYEWQGFMEGAALSGLRAAGEISRDF